MSPGLDEPEPVLEFVDRVLIDLAPPDGMFVGRRVGAGAPGKVLIQSGEEGRYGLTLPDVESIASVEELVSLLRAHVSTVFGKPVPACPVHAHALVCRAVGGALIWMCPDGEWRSPLGGYDERNWPPADLMLRMFVTRYSGG